MNHFKSYSGNHWVTSFLCFSLVAALLCSSTGFILRRAAAQGNTAPQVGEKLGKNLPELSGIRYKTTAEPKSPDFSSDSSPCFDCKESLALDNTFSKARLGPTNRSGEPGVDLLSGNIHWAQPLVNLKGRAGLDLNLSLVYNSLLWGRRSCHRRLSLFG